jgi:hypothetical protein
MAYAVCAFLERRKDGTIAEDVLREWLAPSTLFPTGRPPEDWGYTYAVEVAEHLDLIERSTGQIHLTSQVGTIDEFRQNIRTRVMAKAELAFSEPEDPADELTRALAWWSHQPPQVLTSTTFEPLMAGLPFKPIRQPTRWAVFERWALFLGFAWRFGDGLIPDPTPAVSDVIDDVVPPGEVIDAPVFIRELAAQLPVLDAGQTFQRYRETVGLKQSADILEAPLSMALLRLHQRSEVDFPPRADADGMTLRCGGIERRIAQVRRMPAQSEDGAAR